jgi:hypothetical protein
VYPYTWFVSLEADPQGRWWSVESFTVSPVSNDRGDDANATDPPVLRSCGLRFTFSSST